MDTLKIIIDSLSLIVITVTAIAIWMTLRVSNAHLVLSNQALQNSNDSLKASNEQLQLNIRAQKSTHDWNRRKTTHEILNKFIIGDIPDLNAKIKIDFGCKIYDKKNNYTEFVKHLDNKQKLEFDDTLVRLINIFEVIAIDIKNHIIDEDISYDYLGWFYTAYHRFSEDLITTKRQDAGGDIRVLHDFTTLAQKWADRMKKELQGFTTKGKPEL